MTTITRTTARPSTHESPPADDRPHSPPDPAPTRRPALTDQPRPYPEYNERTPPLIQLLQDLLSPSMQTHTLCSIHHLYPEELATTLASDELAATLDAVRQVARVRLELIKAEAEIAAWTRLTDLASNFPTNARERETARKAAAQIMRLLHSQARAAAEDAPPAGDPTPSEPDPLGTGPRPSPDARPAATAPAAATHPRPAAGRQAGETRPATDPDPEPQPESRPEPEPDDHRPTPDQPTRNGTPSIPTHHPETPRRRPP